MNIEDFNLLFVYNKEIHGDDYYKDDGDLRTELKDLIDSHRELRIQNMKNHKQLNDELQKAREFGYKQGYEMVTKGEYIKVEDLKKMTVQEILDFIQ